MSKIRHSLALSSAERFFSMGARFATLVVTARILTPAEIGVAVLGMAVMGMASVFCEFGGSTYITQANEATAERLQTVFTISLILNVSVALLCWSLADPIATFYGIVGLADFMRLMSISLLLGPFTSPIYALLARNLSFGVIACLSASTATVNTAVTITLAWLGFSYMSFAWAALASAALYSVMCFGVSPTGTYRLSLRDWRNITEYSVVEGMRKMLNYLGDNVPLLILGRTLGAGPLAMFQRAATVSSLPFTTLLAGIQPVVQPMMSERARLGRSLKDGYLTALSYSALFLWPACLVIAVLAHPIALVLLGSQWLDAVPLIQILSTSFTFWFTSNLVTPTLVATGAIRDTLRLATATVTISLVIQCPASLFGLAAVAWSFFATGPISMSLSLLAVKRRVHFEWSEVAAALRPSLLVTLASLVVPVLVVVASGGFHTVTVVAGGLGAIGACAGWLLGLRLARHPFCGEVERALGVADGLAPRLVQPWLKTARRAFSRPG
jgi:O-antigen/teichoic acid export membrane protein